jgi:hypothetical protein
MTTPFTIKMFSVTGDPEGIRVLTKTNWSGLGIVFPKSELASLAQHAHVAEHLKRAGVYVLVGDVAEQTVYIGEADIVGDRLKQHVGSKDWQWAVVFVDAIEGLGKTEVLFLEASLISLAVETGNALLMNKKMEGYPNISPSQRATVNVYLSEMLLIFPLLGIRAFSAVKIEAVPDLPAYFDTTSETLGDTIVVPAMIEGFTNVFLGQNCWYAIRMQQKHIPNIKYIAAYVTAPISAITHIAEVDHIELYNGGPKYIVKFKGPAQAVRNVPMGSSGIASVPRSSRYTCRSKINVATNLADLW